MIKKEKIIKNFDKKFNKCNLKNIQLIKEQLKIYINNPEFINQYINTLKDIIQILFKYLIEGDKTNNNEIISTFVELKILNDIFYIEKLSDYKITSQIIQSLSFFLVNLKNNKSCLYYFFSNNFINNIITIEIENFDDEFYSYYINFLKSLSMRIDNEIILFLYNPELNSFPLVEYAFKFYNNSNPMISTVSLNIMVQIFHVRKNEIIKYFCKLPGINFFIFIINHCKDLIINLMNKFDDCYLYDDLIDYLFYINDLLDLNINEINYIIINTFFNLIIFPIIIENIMNKNKIKETLMIIIMLFFNIKNETFNNIFLYILFNDKFCDYSLKIRIKNIKYYFFSWKEEKNNNFNFLNFIDKNFSKEFILSFLNDESLIYSKSNLSEKCKFSNDLKNIKNEIEDLEKNLNKIEYEDVFNIVFKNIDKNEIKEMNDYHNFLSFITGINVGFSYEKKNKIYYENSFLFKFKEFILNKETNKINNLIKKSFFNNFFCLENENFSINNLINILIFIIQNKINFSKCVLWENNLLIKVENNLKKKCLFKIFTNVFFDLNLYENNFILKENFFIFDNAFFNELKISSLLKNDYILNENLIKKFFELINNFNYIFSINFDKCLLIIKNIFNLFVVNNNKNIKILLINEINSIYKNNIENFFQNKKFNENLIIINLIFYSKNICLNDNKIENELNNINNLLININEKNKQIEQTYLIFLITLINILQEFLFYKNFEKNPFFILCLNRYYNINLINKYFSNNFQIFIFENIFLMFDNIFFYFGEILDENIIKFNDIHSLDNIKIKIKEEKDKINLEICGKKHILNKIKENNIKEFQTKLNLNKEKYNEIINKKYQKINIENYISDLIINI